MHRGRWRGISTGLSAAPFLIHQCHGRRASVPLRDNLAHHAHAYMLAESVVQHSRYGAAVASPLRHSSNTSPRRWAAPNNRGYIETHLGPSHMSERYSCGSICIAELSGLRNTQYGSKHLESAESLSDSWARLGSDRGGGVHARAAGDRGTEEVAHGEAQDAGTPTLNIPEANDDDPVSSPPGDGVVE